MKEANSTETKYQMFEKIMAGGLAIFSAVAIIQLAGAGELIGPLLFALCCLSIALPFLIFQIACIILEVPQRHRVLIQTSTMVIALVGMFGLLISVSSLIGILFAISCICAYYLFTIFSADAKPSEDSTQTELAASSVKAVITTGSTHEVRHFAPQS